LFQRVVRSKRSGSVFRRDRATVDPTHPPQMGRFAMILAIFVAIWWITESLLGLDSIPWFCCACRDLGHIVLLAMLIPWLYVWRRFYLFRFSGNMTRLMRWHIGASYLAVALTLIHCRGRFFGNRVTIGIEIALAAVVLSGVIGYFAQQAVYRIMSLVIR